MMRYYRLDAETRRKLVMRRGSMPIEFSKDSLLERLAALEHDQWMAWAQNIAQTENINPERLKRWNKLFVPYGQLTEEMKERDREWARKVLDIVEGGA